MSVYVASILTNMALISFLALSAYLVLVVGVVSFGQQAFFGVGAYVTATVTSIYGGHAVTGVFIGMLSGAACALVLAILTVRLSGLYFAISTLCFAELCRLGLLQVRAPFDIDGRTTGPDGPEGFSNIRWIFEHNYSVQDFLVLTTVCLVALLGLLFLLERSRIMLRARLVGQDSILAQSLGLRPILYRIVFVTLSGGVAGFGGGLFALFNTYIEPNMFGVMLGVHGLAYAVIGGLGAPIGPLIGVAIDIGLLESIRAISAYRMIAFGGLVALLLILLPQGLISPRFVARMRRWRKLFHV
ncbi:MAG: branched-chain amino acid ABC transporter permease [Octadecabacter sp.]|nr:branched-chain amino acid ABC transporter permease [Octadecabacter sp.]|tara:strand:+ start:10667 stop:11566 length:900 start_codon:yes stop_codon:yes gene_type:complete